MKRSVVSSVVFSLFAGSSVAHADELQNKPDTQSADGYEPVRAVLFVPTESIPLTPSAMCPVSQSGADNAGLGCVAGLAEAGDYTPPANVDDVVAGLTTALEPFNILVTSTRPPEFVPYQMLLPSDEENLESLSRTCAGAAIDCDGVQRNDIAFTNGGTMFCMDPDAIQAALIAFGYMSGLENNDNPMDPMYYRAADPWGPDYAMPSVAYDDTCSALVQTVDDMEMINPLQCPASINHEPYCDGMENQTNNVAELTAYYGAGPWVEDTTAPTVDAMTIPEDGAMVDMLELSATVTDDQGLAFVRWTIEGAGLAGMAPADANGRVCKGHNAVCAVEFDFPPPYRQAEDGVYAFNELSVIPGGEYTITFEAADLAGNAIEPVVRAITFEGAAADTSGGMTTMSMTTDPTDPTGDDNGDSSTDDGGSEDDGNDTGEDDEGGGCSCSTEPGLGGAAALLVGVFGFVATRRRRS